MINIESILSKIAKKEIISEFYCVNPKIKIFEIQDVSGINYSIKMKTNEQALKVVKSANKSLEIYYNKDNNLFITIRKTTYLNDLSNQKEEYFLVVKSEQLAEISNFFIPNERKQQSLDYLLGEKLQDIYSEIYSISHFSGILKITTKNANYEITCINNSKNLAADDSIDTFKLKVNFKEYLLKNRSILFNHVFADNLNEYKIGFLMPTKEILDSSLILGVSYIN